MAGLSSIILRPNGVGDFTNIAGQSPLGGAHWDKVNEVVPDEDARFVFTGGIGEEQDVYALDAPPTGLLGTISHVTVWHRCRVLLGGAAQARPILRLGGVNTLGLLVNLGIAYADNSEILARPGGGVWQLADLPGLQAGIGLAPNPIGNRRCTQVWIQVFYSSQMNRAAFVA